MLKDQEDVTPCSFHLIDNYPDYHPEHLVYGGGRSVDNNLFSLPELGDCFTNRGQRVIQSATETPLVEQRQHWQSNRRANPKGQVGWTALVGGLLRALLDLGIEPEVNTPAIKLYRRGMSRCSS